MESIYFSTSEVGPRNDNLVIGPVKASGGISATSVIVVGLQVFGMELGNYPSANLGSYLRMVQITQLPTTSRGFI